MKPLYLNGKPGMSVALDEPALRVIAPGQAAVLFPLQRVSRVIASGPVEWSTDALLACAEHGISVTFLARGGAIRAYLFGCSHLRGGLFHRLRDLLDRPDWGQRYADWLRAMESRARRAVARQLRILKPEDWNAERLQQSLAICKERHVGPGVRRHIDRKLRGLLAGLVAELLTEAGLGAERIRGIEERLDLLNDLTELLAWDLHLPVLEWLAEQAGSPDAGTRIDDASLVRLFERRGQRLRRLGRALLNRLHGWLLELNA